MLGIAQRGLVSLLAAAIALAPTTAPAALAADPAKVLRIEFYVAETGFDPVKVQDYYSQTVCEAIFESLMTYDYLARPAKLAPRAAEAMPVISDRGQDIRLQDPQGHLLRAGPGVQGQAARIDGRRLRLHDQALPRSGQQVAVRELSRRRARARRSQEGRGKDRQVRLRPQGRRPAGPRSLHAQGQTQGNRLQLRAHPRIAEYRSSGEGGDRSLCRRHQRPPGRHRPVHAQGMEALEQDRARGQPIVSRHQLAVRAERRSSRQGADRGDGGQDDAADRARRNQHHRGAAGGVARFPE